ncbi:MAG: formylglycine-generating enzyme family protein [Treponema sp.]
MALALVLAGCQQPSSGGSDSSGSGASSGGVTLKMVFVKGGKVTGKENTNNYAGVFIKDRTVTLSDFYMSKYEVTKAQYKAIMEGNEYEITADPSYSTLKPKTYVMAEGEEDYERPVENVSWYDAVYFCNLLSKKEGLEPVYTIESLKIGTADITNAGSDGNEKKQIKYISSATVTADHKKNGYRLPTEAEWEYAASGGDPSVEAWDYTFSGAPTASGTSYNSSSNAGLDAVGWYRYNNDTGTTGSSDVTGSASGKGTHQVGQKAPNALGIYDISGNVWEWCYDWYSSTVSTGSETDPTGSSSGSSRVLRGGSWYGNAYYASVCFRYYYTPSYGDYYLGFRLVRSAQPTLKCKTRRPYRVNRKISCNSTKKCLAIFYRYGSTGSHKDCKRTFCHTYFWIFMQY